MKKYIPYIIGAVVLVLLIVLILQGKTDKRFFDEHITLVRNDKNPYGSYVAYENLHYLFPEASVSINRKEPGYWDSLSYYSDKQALVIISPRFLPDEFELNQIIRFVKKGNTVFISTAEVSSEVTTMLKCEIPEVYQASMGFTPFQNRDTTAVGLLKPPFGDGRDFGSPARHYESYFFTYDAATTTVLGNSYLPRLYPDFIQLRAGEGHLYLHLTPLAFSNYFLLHKKNINYYNQAMSVIPSDTKKVVWDEYFLRKRNGSSNEDDDNSPGVLSGLMKSPAFKAAFLLSLLLLLLYILQEMRRKQRFIPEMPRPKNDSVVFVSTIGKLYYEKGDHLNLARKMAAYFREHVRSRYKLSTSYMNDEFIRTLGIKTAYSEEGIREIVSFITMIDTAEVISAETLASFHRKLEDFYNSQ